MLKEFLWNSRPTEVYKGLKMELDPGEWTQMQLLKRNCLEPLTLALYSRVLEPGDCFVDVGAHVGFHSLMARQMIGPDGLVICVEPQPGNAQKILVNWRANGYTNLKLLVAAAGAVNGWVELNDQLANDRSVLTLLPIGGKNEAQKFQVPIVRLETVLQREALPAVKLLKIDVEGYELEVIRGLGRRLNTVNHIILEVLSGTPQPRIEELASVLQSDGFELRTVQGVPWQPGLPLPENNVWAAQHALCHTGQ